MEYDLIVDPYAPAALLIFIVACVLPCTNIPQPEITVLELTGVIVTLPIDGITLDGAVIVNPYVVLPSYTPLVLYVSSVAVAAPDVAEGMALSHDIGIVYEANVTPAATDCVLE